MGLLAGMVNYVNTLVGFFIVLVAIGLLLGGFQNLDNLLLAAFSFGAGAIILLLFVLKWLFGREVTPEQGLTLSNVFLVFALVITVFLIVFMELFFNLFKFSPFLTEAISAFFVLLVIFLIIVGLLIPNWTLAEIRDAFLGLLFPKEKKKRKRVKKGK